MKLTWGNPFWPAQSESINYPPPQEGLRCDVLIVGAGATGALIADALTREGMNVVAADKREPGHGSTAASTALLLYELDTPLRDLAGMIGAGHANRVYQMGVEAIDRLERISQELDDDCGFRRAPSVYLCSDGTELADLNAEYEARRRAGLGVELLKREDLGSMFGFDRAGAILSRDAAEVDPYRLTQGLLGRSLDRGLRLFGHCEIVEAKPTGGGILATTQGGPSIAARQIVYATGYEAAPLLGKNRVKSQVSYAAVSKPLDGFRGWWERCLIWETARPYSYVRTTPDNRAMIGGMDDDNQALMKDAGHLNRKASALRQKFGELFPRIRFEVDAAWAGVFDTTPDGMPYIGRYANFPGALFALGYGGNGLTFGAIAAEIVRDLCLGRVNPDAALFDFTRQSAASTGQHGGDRG